MARRIAAAGGRAAVCEADVSKFDQAAAVAEAVIKAFGKIDHLVNNAGITRDNLFMRMKEEEWDAVLAVNLKGVFNFSKAVIRSMVQARYGRIVNLSSVVGAMGNAGQANYCGLQSGPHRLQQVARPRGRLPEHHRQLRRPGLHRHGHDREAARGRQEDVPRTSSRCSDSGRPEDVARAVRFLCSDDAAYITGQVLHVNGGMYM